MDAIGGTPKDYGLRVRSHPVLMVTSKVKMRHGTVLQLSFDSDTPETVVHEQVAFAPFDPFVPIETTGASALGWSSPTDCPG